MYQNQEGMRRGWYVSRIVKNGETTGTHQCYLNNNSYLNLDVSSWTTCNTKIVIIPFQRFFPHLCLNSKVSHWNLHEVVFVQTLPSRSTGATPRFRSHCHDVTGIQDTQLGELRIISLEFAVKCQRGSRRDHGKYTSRDENAFGSRSFSSWEGE